MKIVLNIIKTIITGFIFTIIPVVLFLLITSRTSFLFGLRSYTVLTGSMVPRIPVLSMVFVKPQHSYQIGEIITFNRGDITVTHRIHAIHNDEFVTKGDANKIADPDLVPQSQIIGEDVLIVPYIGKFTEFLKSVPGFIIFIALPILVFIGFELMNIKKEIERQTEIRVRKQFESQLESKNQIT
jgi:signal peptidase I